MRLSASCGVKLPATALVFTSLTTADEYAISSPACCATRLSVLIAGPAGISKWRRVASAASPNEAANTKNNIASIRRAQSDAGRGANRGDERAMRHGYGSQYPPRRLTWDFT